MPIKSKQKLTVFIGQFVLLNEKIINFERGLYFLHLNFLFIMLNFKTISVSLQGKSLFYSLQKAVQIGIQVAQKYTAR